MSDWDTKECPFQTASEMLVSAREQLNLTQEDIASQLYLNPSFIRYIDDGLFNKIPKRAFIKGYLRSYARVVGLSEDEVVARYEEGMESDHRVDIHEVTQERFGSAALTGPVLQTGLIGLSGIVIVVALVWALSGDDEDELRVEEIIEAPELLDELPELETLSLSAVPTVIVENESQENVEEPNRQVLVLNDESIDAPIQVSSEQVSVQDDDGVADNLEAFSAIETTKEINVERTSDDGFEYITVDSGGFDQLEFTFTEKCWVEIKDADGETIYGDLNRDSDILTVYGTAPLKILLGRSSAVTLRHNGTEIDLGLHTRSDQTARLTVGG